VESLLAQQGGDRLLERPAMEVAAPLLADATVTRLTVGEQLGPFKVEAALGAGGMGEVYKARDTRLGRAVFRAGSSARGSCGKRGPSRH
jgi:hypothetical protein